MSKSATNVDRKLASISRSIEVITEKANRIWSCFTGCESNNDSDHYRSVPVDDSNTDLQSLFQHLERLLQVDLKNRQSLISNKGNYWNFFALSLKESKGLYDSVLFVLNSPEVKTSAGRGRLFLRFCLQHHRLGDVIQQSFMMEKYVHQFYIDDSFWKKSNFIDRVIQALYQLNDIEFDLLSNVQYQLDICWPSNANFEKKSRNSLNGISRCRTNSVSSCLSMESLLSQSLTNSSIPIVSSLLNNFDVSTNNESFLTTSISSFDEEPENCSNSPRSRFEKFEIRSTLNDAETQSEIDQQDQICQTTNDENSGENQSENFQTQISLLKDEINILNFQLSSARIQQNHSEEKIKEFEKEIARQQNLAETKTNKIVELQNQIEEQKNRTKQIQEENATNSKRQEQKIDSLTKEKQRIENLIEEERISFEKERVEQKRIQEELEFSLREKTLDFDEMKRRLIKAIQEKADLFSSIYNYELKLGEEQSKEFLHEDDVRNCQKCQTAFGWTLRKYRCRNCQKIFCYYCSNHSKPGPLTSGRPHRLCDFCYESYLRESLRSDYTVLEDPNEKPKEIDLNFRVRAETSTANGTD